MRSHAKAASSGSSTRQGSRPGALTIVAAFALVFVAFLGIGASAAMADNTPSVVTNAAESVGVTTAKLSGSVNPNGEAGTGTTTWRLEYTPAGAGTWATANSGEVTGIEAEEANPVAVEAIFGFGGELHPGSEYEFRLVAENGAGQATSSTRAFTMQPATAPLLTANAASAVEYTTATLHGELDPAGGNENVIASEVLPIHWQLQYSLAGQGSWSTGGEGMIENAEAKENGTPIALSAPLSSGSLQPGSEYESRLVAFYASPAAPLEEASSPGPVFTTLDVTAPAVTADAGSAITASSAKFTGEVTNGNGDPAFNSGCEFEYVTDAQFNAVTEGGFAKAQHLGCQPNPVEGAAATPVEAEATGLESHRIYHLRLSATNAGGTTTDDAPSTFTTTAVPPSVQTIYAGDIHGTSATLRGWVNPHNSQTSYYFLWGTEDCSANPCQALPASEDADAGSGGAVVAAHQTLTGLSPNTTYHYLLVATNSAGTEEALDRSFTTAASDQGECANEARRVELHATALGDCRAWELASPGTPSDVMADSGRTQAAASESPGLPMAVKFSSLAGMGEAEGSGIAFDYLSQRTAAAGTSGWSFRGITPPQEPLSFAADVGSVDPLYDLLSPDLRTGIFRSFSSLPGTATNAAAVPNLYLRGDLRSGAAGSYQLLTDSAAPQPPLTKGGSRPRLAGTSADFSQVLFESRLNLTPDASGENVKLYKSDHGVVRRISIGLGCPGQTAPGQNLEPCDEAGIGASPTPGGAVRYTPHVISDDGIRINVTTPFGTTIATMPSTKLGVVSKLYQLDDRGTATTEDDAVAQLTMSEKPSPDVEQGAIYETASADGSRVFFLSSEQLTETPGSGLYMWERQGEDEAQELAVDASGGSFTLTAHSRPSHGPGELTEGSSTIFMKMAQPGSFAVGQTIEGEGIPAGTTVTEVGTFGGAAQKKIVISNPIEPGVSGTKDLTASVEDTTTPLPWNATPAEVQGALEGLSSIGSGNVAVGGTGPYSIEFTGALAGTNVMQLTTDAGELTGGSSTASVTTTNDVRNLTLIGAGAGGSGFDGVIGTSEDGTRVYFAISGDIWQWEDADGVLGGTLYHVATLPAFSMQFQVLGPEMLWSAKALTTRVTPDGRALFFEAGDGSTLPPGYQHGDCSETTPEVPMPVQFEGQCSEAYVYRADTSTPSEPDIVCASCNFAVPGASGDTFPNARKGAGASLTAVHFSRALTDDGKRVFFNTTEAIDPNDTNGSLDVYEYDVDGGEIHLISGGIDEAPSYLMDASADGSDVFFVTRARLAGWDDDNAYDLYDARAGGGFPEPPAETAPCNGDSCKGVAGAAPPAPRAGSAALGGAGNVKGRHGCPKGRHAVERKGKVRCVKRHHRKHHKRHANNNRRTGK